MDFRVPELGEGIDSATVVRVLTAPGDTIRPGQEIVEVETDKATMPILAEQGGTISEVLVKPGDKVKIGAILMRTGANSTANGKSAATAPTPASSPKSVVQPTSSALREKFQVLLPSLGEGIASGTVVTIAVKPGDTVAAEQSLIDLETDKATIPIPSPVKGSVVQVAVERGQVVKVGALIAVLDAEEPASQVQPTPVSTPPAASIQAAKPAAASETLVADRPALVAAGPATRRLARELGVDLRNVTGTARGGRVTADDVRAYVRALPKTGEGNVPATALAPLPNFARWGPVEKKPFSALRKAIARNLSASWSIAPQVTQHDLADITSLEGQRKKYSDEAPKGSPKITMTVLAIRACVAALKAFPHFNSSYDPTAGDNGELILKKYIHIGIAVDTERGLVVPVIRDADKKGLAELAKELNDLAERARAGKLTPDEMKGGTFTITNLGGIGGTAFSPIINYPEVAILGLSRSTWQPVVRDGKIEPRLMLPLSLTYDHRVIDGADGARFCARLAEMFSNPIRMLFEG